MRSALFFDFTQRRMVVTDVSGQPIGIIFKVQAALLTIDEDGTYRLSLNVGKKLSFYAA
jgi:hypothetical protein